MSDEKTVRMELRPEDDSKRVTITLTSDTPITVAEFKDVMIQYLAQLPEDDDVTGEA